MKNLTATILIGILTIAALPLCAADKTEDKIQGNLEQRIEKLNAAFKRFQDFKAVYAKTPAKNREAVLRTLCSRMQKETKAINTAIATMDTYLEIKSFTHEDVEDLNDTKDSISNIKGEIEELKRSLGLNTTPKNQIAKN